MTSLKPFPFIPTCLNFSRKFAWGKMAWDTADVVWTLRVGHFDSFFSQFISVGTVEDRLVLFPS